MTAATLIAGCGGGSDTASPGDEQAQRQGGGPSEESGGGEKSIEEFGEKAAGSERTAIEGAFKGYLAALAEEDFQAACSYLASNVQESLRRLVVKKLKDKGCAAILPLLLASSASATARQQAQGEITKIRVGGDRAFVVFRAPGAKLYQMTMEREDGKWKTVTLTSSVLVPAL